jgi:hypothetical protein
MVMSITGQEGFCQEQIIIHGDHSSRIISSGTFAGFPGFPGGFVDLKDLRDRCDAVWVKIAVWLKPWDGVPTVGLFYLADHADPEGPIQGQPIVEVTARRGWLKVESDWADLFERVPAAEQESLGYFFVGAKSIGGWTSCFNPTIILKCVHYEKVPFKQRASLEGSAQPPL